MRRLIRFGLATLGVLGLWTAVVGIGLLEGWWRSPLAPRGDTQAFMNSLVREVETARRGNVALALIEKGSVHAERVASIGEPLDRDTAFQVASLSKWVTAWGVMALVEQGRLDLDAPVSRYLTRWALPETGFDNDGVTVRRLLSHTAGLTDGLGYGGLRPAHRCRPWRLRSRRRRTRRRARAAACRWAIRRARGSSTRAAATRCCSC